MRFTDGAGGKTPDPDTETGAAVLLAFEVMVTDADLVPVDCGAKTILTTHDWPGATEAVHSFITVNTEASVPVTVTAPTDKFASPMLEICRVCGALGFAVIWS